MYKQSYQINMREGALSGKLLLFALPLMLSTALQLLFNAADIIVVGRFVGKEALAAVGSNTALIQLMINLFVGLSVGTNVVVARDLGAGRLEQVKDSVHTSITMALISGVLMSIFGVLMVGEILVWMSSPSDVIEMATVYLRIFFLGMPALIVYNFGAAILRAQGDTRRPLYYLTFAGVVNVGLNLVFVTVLHMDVAGVALATIAAQYISAGLVLRCLARETGPLRLDWRQLRLKWPVSLKIIQVGLPAGLQGMVFALSSVVVQSALNSFDDPVVAAGSAAASNLEGFVYVSMNAFHQTALSFTGQNYGAGLTRRVDKVALLCPIYCVLTGLIIGNFCYFFGNTLAGLYAPGEVEVIAQAMIRLSYICRFFFVCGVMEAMVGVLRGMSYSVAPMWVSLLGACGLRLAWVAWIFPLNPTPATLYAAYPVTWFITSCAQVALFFLVRKRAYAKVTSTAQPAYLSTEGIHPTPFAPEPEEGKV